jgi:hypothetical protein
VFYVADRISSIASVENMRFAFSPS